MLKMKIAVDTDLNAIVYRDDYDVPVRLKKYTIESLARILVLIKKKLATRETFGL